MTFVQQKANTSMVEKFEIVSPIIQIISEVKFFTLSKTIDSTSFSNEFFLVKLRL